MTPEGPANVFLTSAEEALTRPAVMVWRTPDGIAWLEPAYLDEQPASRPAFHRIVGKVHDTESGIYVDSDYRALVIDRMRAEGPMAAPELDRAFEAYQKRLRELGTTYLQERVRMTTELAKALA